MRLAFPSAIHATVAAAALTLGAPGAIPPASGPHSASPEAPRQVLDRAVAVVNNQVILLSDLDLELRLAHLLPMEEQSDDRSTLPATALQRLITRALMEQQIVQEDAHGLDVAPRELEDSLDELRRNLPACKLHDCASPAGWRAYLATLGLTPERVQEYWAHRIAVLRFIEQRFRSGIRIAPEEIEAYYRQTLLPRYPNREDAPPLDQVSQRIQEVLLQQRVNALLDDWLKTLQDQGQVEILDPSLKAAQPETAPAPALAPPGKEPGLERF